MFISGSIWNRVHTFYLTLITQNSWELVKSTIFLLCPSTDFFLLFRTSYLVENIIVWSPHSFSSVVTQLASHHLSFSFFPWSYKLALFPDTLFGGSIFHRKFSGSFCVTSSTNSASFCWFPVIFLWAQDCSKLPLNLSPDGIIHYNSYWFGYINYRK